MARTKRREFDNDQKAQMNKRATDASGAIRCEGCGLALKRGVIEYDHIIPEALRSDEDKKKKITISEGQVLGRDCCHRGEGSKTSRDQKQIAKAKRQEKKHNGITKPKGTIQSPGFAKAEKAKATGKLSLPPRKLYK